MKTLETVKYEDLNIDQKRVVNSIPNGHSLVKGVAGCGKTSIAIHRIPTLINHHTENHEKILLVTYNRYLINYLKECQKKFYNKDYSDYLDIKTIDSLICYYSKKIENVDLQIPSETRNRDLINICIKKIRQQYPKLLLIDEKNADFLLEEINWIKACNYIDREVYQTVERRGRMSIGDNKYQLQKDSTTRAAIFDLYLAYEALLKQNNLTDFKTRALNVLHSFNSNKLPRYKYRHIIVDECQDLTRVQLNIIQHLLKANGSLLFLSDVAQSIYTHSWLSVNPFSSINLDMSGRSTILSKNYRTTYEIAQAAYSLFRNDNEITKYDDFVKPTAIERHGDLPCYNHFPTFTDQLNYIVKKIYDLSDRYNLKDIAIIAYTNKYLDLVKEHLIRCKIDAVKVTRQTKNFDDNKVKLFTFHSIKGQEYPVIFIAGINDGTLPQGEFQDCCGRKLLYVGMTRAQQELYLTSHNTPSPFLQEMDQSLLRNGDTIFSPYYQIPLEQYRFVSPEEACNSKEESVRQWFINELITKLHYPENFIEIEYPVNRGSIEYRADIMINTIENNSLIPYILVETKPLDGNLDFADKQINSYLASVPTVKYKVLTNGNNILIYEKREGKWLNGSIPIFNQNLGNTYIAFEIQNFKTDNHYIYKVNTEDKEEIQLFNKKSNSNLIFNDLYSLNVCGEVAAGPLKYAENNYMECFDLPDSIDLVSTCDFVLKVSGDSMIDFGIFNGDYVFIKKQSFASNNDIVIAGKKSTEEATMKKITKDVKPNIIRLIPGNSKYRPILINESDIFINGIVLGKMSPCNNI